MKNKSSDVDNDFDKKILGRLKVMVELYPSRHANQIMK